MAREMIYWAWEGPPGSGKSTQFKKFKDWYLRTFPNSQALFVCEPDKDTEIGRAMREIFQGLEFSGEISPTASLLQVAAARAQLIETKVRPAIENGVAVFSDRCCESSRVFQVIEGSRREDVEDGIRIATAGLEPNKVVVFDLALEEMRKRMEKANRVDDRFEKLGPVFLARVKDGYLQRAREDPDRIFVVDGSGDESEVFGRVTQALLGVEGA
ncbi:dTMP kinase [Candidatus Amesbacteria bacterium]|nr:dTMP kinase [Candidatus Amesbacteria bacterium]